MVIVPVSERQDGGSAVQRVSQYQQSLMKGIGTSLQQKIDRTNVIQG